MSTELQLAGLTIEVGGARPVSDMGLSLSAGEVVGLVGPSGSGKTLTARSLLGLVDLAPGVVAAELSVTVEGQRHTPYDPLPRSRRQRERAFATLRGDVVGYLPQDAPRSLDPARRVGAQLQAVARRGERDPDPVPWLVAAGFDAAEAPTVAQRFPHQLSGGMAQRVAIAQVLARGSRLLVADEPTTGLDAAVQRQLLTTFRRLAEGGLGVLLVSHDLRWLAEVVSRAYLMHQGGRAEVLSREELVRGTARSEVGQRLLAAVGQLRSAGFP